MLKSTRQNPLANALSLEPEVQGQVFKARDALKHPVAVVDIGSNSVRLVVFDGLKRAATPVFNEKMLCGLGRNLSISGQLHQEGLEIALSALKRFRSLCDLMHIQKIYVLATAAARDASNGPTFLANAEEIMQAPATLVSGQYEAELAASGVLAGFHKPNGIVCDMGGGSLEIIDVSGDRLGEGVSLKLGGLALRDKSGRSLKKAEKIVKDALKNQPPLLAAKGRDLYAVGGTWRAIARLHLREKNYPLNVLHGYSLSSEEMLAYCRRLQKADLETIVGIKGVASDRKPLVPYGALVMEHLLLQSGVKRLIVSAFGLREGFLHGCLTEEQKRSDALILASMELNALRSRAPQHGEDLSQWCAALFKEMGVVESEEEQRLRHSACLLSDIAWRAHPDYRGEQSLNVIANANLPGIDHPGRAFIALTCYFRHLGTSESELPMPRLKELLSPELFARAELLGTMMRVAYLLSAGMAGVLQESPLTMKGKNLVLQLPLDRAALANDRIKNRLKQLGKAFNVDARIEVTM